MDLDSTIDSQSGMEAARGLTRTLRHEVGDFLQVLYSTVSVLSKRLPPEWELERSLLTNLRARAEASKLLLDTVHDYVWPMSLTCSSVDLGALAARLVAGTAPRYPHLEVRSECSGSVRCVGDVPRLTQLGNLMLVGACDAARQCVVSTTALNQESGDAEWSITDDGPSGEVSSRSKRLGLGLAPARKVALAHGGSIGTTVLPDGHFRVTVLLPKMPPGTRQPVVLA